MFHVAQTPADKAVGGETPSRLNGEDLLPIHLKNVFAVCMMQGIKIYNSYLGHVVK